MQNRAEHSSLLHRDYMYLSAAESVARCLHPPVSAAPPWVRGIRAGQSVSLRFPCSDVVLTVPVVRRPRPVPRSRRPPEIAAADPPSDAQHG